MRSFNGISSDDHLRHQIPGRTLKIPYVISKFTREYLAIEVGVSLCEQNVTLGRDRLLLLPGKPAFFYPTMGRNSPLSE
ncbi:hypothetical protein KESI111651_09455 [Kerstersia similis]